MINKHVLRVSFTTQSFHLSVRPFVSPCISHSPDASLPGRACSLGMLEIFQNRQLNVVALPLAGDTFAMSDKFFSCLDLSDGLFYPPFFFVTGLKDLIWPQKRTTLVNN